MAAPDIALKKGEVLLTQTTGVIEFDNSPWLVGIIELVNELSNGYDVGDSVAFDPTNATKLKYPPAEYFLIQESAIQYREVPT